MFLRAENNKPQFNLAIVTSRFNEEITGLLYQHALQRLKQLDFSDEQITSIWVPGAVEIPLAAQRLAQTNRYAAILCYGAVIRGETDHYDYVCQQVSMGCQHVALEFNLPVLFGVLTTENEEQALARQTKGSEVVDAAMDMLAVLQQIT
jgi:6,7-dimethyl-8-ribityllumazine synthase